MKKLFRKLLRDYFAAKAMQAIITKMPYISEETHTLADLEAATDRVTYGAYAYADVMMEARLK